MPDINADTTASGFLTDAVRSIESIPGKLYKRHEKVTACAECSDIAG